MLPSFQSYFLLTCFFLLILFYPASILSQFVSYDKGKEKKLIKAYAKQLSTKNNKAIRIFIQAENHFLRKQYLKSIVLLKKAIEKDKNFIDAYMRLGSTYLMIGDLDLAEKLFSEMSNKLKHHAKAHRRFFYLGKIALEKEEYAKAQPFLEQFLSSQTDQKNKLSISYKVKAEKYLKNISYALKNTANILPYQPVSLHKNINKFPYQYFPSLSADEKIIVYTVLRGNHIHQQEDIFISHKDENDQWEEGYSISSLINTPDNEGTCTLSANKKYLIFTICNNKKVIGRCDLFVSENIGNHWMPPKNLGANINSSAWESQPSVSADGNTLYFSSDRAGGFGKKDIYMAKKSSNGHWEEAINLGGVINTPDDDLAPFIHNNSTTLYFASKGHPGFGNFDIYKSELTIRKDSINNNASEAVYSSHLDADSWLWSKPENLGYPINNFQEQSGIYVNLKGDTAYFTHTNNSKMIAVRGGIHKFRLPEHKRATIKSTYVYGKIVDAKTRLPLEAIVNLYLVGKKNSITSTKSDPVTGEYLVVLNEGADYLLYITKPTYLFSNQKFSFIKDLDSPILWNVSLIKIEEGKAKKLKNLLFESNSHHLNSLSTTELQRLFDFLNQNTRQKISIHGHTDNVGSPSDNLLLSHLRAKSVYSYLIDLGINPKQIDFTGFGESKPVATNKTIEGRALNRRIEFVIK